MSLRKVLLILLMAAMAVGLPSGGAGAQSYSFSLDQETVDFFLEADGTLRIEYGFTFTNDPGAPPIEFVDVGMPNPAYSLRNVVASVDGHPIISIEDSPYVEPGIALGLGSNAIPPGATGTVRMSITGVQNVLYEADIQDYASVVLSPTWFDRDLVHGDTDLIVAFHLPPGIQPDEPRWFDPPRQWPQEAPSTGSDAEGRVLYVWRNTGANGYTQYRFGAAFPQQYVPASAIQHPTLLDRLGIPIGALISYACFGSFGLFMLLAIVAAVRAGRKRKLAYLPPKISIEGHGIKRGLTAVEAAILLETPLDKVLTMILFGLIKKEAARVITEDPLKIERLSLDSTKLRKYEQEFLDAVVEVPKRKRHAALQRLMIQLVRSVQKKMKGFSLKESQQYYRSIIAKAWNQVEAADTPEVKSARFAEDLEWAMLDDDFDDRTRRTFQTGPVFVPVWWGHYRPHAPSARPSTVLTGSAPARTGGISLPQLPGADFAASIVNGVQNTAGSLVSDVVNFTGGVTQKTNPPPKPSTSSRSSGWRSSGGSGCACACACACAGCACACAGGGR